MNDDETLQLETETAQMNSEKPALMNSGKNEGPSSVTCFSCLLKVLYLLLYLQEVLLST